MTDRTWTDEDLTVAVGANITIAGTLRALGLTTSPGNYRTFHVHVERLGLDTNHFQGKAHLTGRSRPGMRITIPLAEILVENSGYTNIVSLKRRLLRDGLLTECCAECDQGPEWRGGPLTLQLEHRNGNPRDHRLGNLCLLCPNCHTQTSTFNGKTQGRYRAKKERHVCIDCGTETSGSRWTRCTACAPKAAAQSKIEWPDPQTLLARVHASTYTRVGQELGVSGTAVKKHLVTRGML